MPYIYSTLSNNHSYAVYPANIDPKQITPPDRTITINGGANVANKKTLLTPRGAVTHVEKEDLEILKTLKTFMRHKQRGFISFSDSATATDPDRAAKNMTAKDESAQTTPEDYDKDKQPKTGKV